MKNISVKTKCLAVGIVAVIIAAALFVGGMSMLDWQFAKLDSTVWEAKNFAPEATELNAVSLDCDFTKVEIVSGDALSVDYEESDDTKYKVSLEDGKLDIRETRKFSFKMFNFYTPVMKITLPETDKLNLFFANGDCNLSDMTLAAMEIGGANLNVSLTNVTAEEKISLTTVNGEIKLNGVNAGNIDAKTTNGKITLNKVNASESIFVYSLNGGVYSEYVNANSAEFKTTNGKINLENVYAESLKGKSLNGGISAHGIKSHNIDMNSTNGKIAVVVVGNRADYRIHCNSTNGSSNESDKTDGIYSIEVRTLNGDIRITFEEEGENDD